MLTLEEARKRLIEKQEEFPMFNRQLGELLGVNHMTIYRHAAALGIAKRTGWPNPYSFADAEKITESIVAPKPKHRETTAEPPRVRVRFELSREEWNTLKGLAEKQDLAPFMLVYKLVAGYIRENKQLF